MSEITRAMRRSVIASASYTCQLCGLETDDGEVEFITPLAKGGQHRLFNLRYVCCPCYKRRRQAPVVEKTDKPKKINKPKKTGDGYDYLAEHLKFKSKGKQKGR